MGAFYTPCYDKWLPVQTKAYQTRVYYEDTDALGIVYHTQYLKWMERARTELLLSKQVTFSNLSQWNCFFVVAHCQFSCLHPAKLGECISVSTQLITLGHTRSRWRQTVFCEQKALCEATLTLAIVDAQGKLTKIHPSLKERLCHS